MTHKTKGIVLRTTKYGETSLVVTIFTELFGIQTYLVNGVRTSSQASAKAMYFQPAAILDLVVYHQQNKNMHRIREFKWDYLYIRVFGNVIRNSIALFMVELLYKSLKQPEQNPPLFEFCEDVLKELDKADNPVAANLPLFFTLHLSHFLGFRLIDNYDEENTYLDLQEGCFTPFAPGHAYLLEGEQARVTSELLKTLQPAELSQVILNKETRRNLLLSYQDYYTLHVHDFGKLKTLAVLNEVL